MSKFERVFQAGGHRNLRRQMEHLPHAGDRLAHEVTVADVGRLHPQARAERGTQPSQVVLHAGSGKIVEDQHGSSGRQQARSQIGADEASPTGDQRRALTIAF